MWDMVVSGLDIGILCWLIYSTLQGERRAPYLQAYQSVSILVSGQHCITCAGFVSPEWNTESVTLKQVVL